MPIIPQTYYLDAPTLASASSIFLDSGLTSCAPDGYYSNGVITRQLVSCKLLPQQPCKSCGIPCGESISGSGGEGIYLLNIDSGSAVGAIVVQFNPFSIPDGIAVTFNGVVYNALSSPSFGFLKSAVPNTVTYIGNSDAACAILSGGSINLTEYIYNGTSFSASGNIQSITIGAPQVVLTPGNPGSCVMVIPKTTASPSVLAVQVLGVCGATAWDILIDCPVILTPILRSTVTVDLPKEGTPEITVFCELLLNLLFYRVPVTGTPLILGLYDWVFQDQYGGTVLVDGFYKVSTLITPAGEDTIHVQNGIITEFLTLCSLA